MFCEQPSSVIGSEVPWPRQFGFVRQLAVTPLGQGHVNLCTSNPQRQVPSCVPFGILSKGSCGSTPPRLLPQISKCVIFFQPVSDPGIVPLIALLYTLKDVMPSHAPISLGSVPVRLPDTRPLQTGW